MDPLRFWTWHGTSLVFRRECCPNPPSVVFVWDGGAEPGGLAGSDPRGTGRFAVLPLA